MQEGIIYEANHSYSVDWGKAEEVFGNEPGAYWTATEEQRAEAERIERIRTIVYRIYGPVFPSKEAKPLI